MIAPTVLPGRAYKASTRTSRLLFHWRAADLSLTPLTGETPTFARASAGGYVVDVNGKLRNPVHSQPRWEMVDLDDDGVFETPGLLLEGQRTNVVLESENLGAWSVVGTPVLTSGQADPVGGTAAYVVADDDAGVAEYLSTLLGFTGDGEKVLSVFVRQGTASAFDLVLYDSSVPATRHHVRVTWTGGVPALSSIAGGGTLFPIRKLGGGWYRVAFSATGVVAANANNFHLRPTTATAADVGSTYFFGAQAENGVFPSSYIRTVGATVTRSEESLSYPIGFAPPVALTAYVKLQRPVQFDRTTAAQTTILLQIGGLAGRVHILRDTVTPTLLTAFLDTAGTDVSVTRTVPTGTPVEVCVRCLQIPTGGTIELDVGAGYGAPSGAASGLTAWAENRIHLARAANLAFFAGLQEVKIAAVSATMAQMRRLF